MNWTFANLPTETDSQRRYKCSQKLGFSCECKTASTVYDVGTIEDVHPFCLTDEGKVHGACTGGCIDINYKNVVGDSIDGATISIEAECINIQRSWTPPIYPTCTTEKGENVYNLNAGGSCDTAGTCNVMDTCRLAGSCADDPATTEIDEGCTLTAVWDQNGVPVDDTHIPGVCRMPDTASGSIKDVSADFSTEEACLSNYTWVPPMNKVKKYYEISHATEVGEGEAKTVEFSENDDRQCIAGDSVQERYGITECPKNDPFCNQWPKIDRVDIDSDNYNTMILSASFTKYGKVRRCDSRGELDVATGKYDNQIYPLAPCPSIVPYYCDYPQNELFGSKDENDALIDTSCGVGKYNNKTRNVVGLPHGIREFQNGYDLEAFQWSVEQEDSVSLATNMNAVLSEMETVQMNIYSVGKLINRKFTLESTREGLDEQFVDELNAKELANFFNRMALTGDAIPFSNLTSAEDVLKEAEWSPTDLSSNGETDQLRCHTVADSVLDTFRTITDVRRDFVDRFFNANQRADCEYGDAILDNETGYTRCANHEDNSIFLYPSVRKAFVNPIKSDFFLSGFMKGQRFVKEMGRSKEELGFVNAGKRTMPDGTDIQQNATYDHMKFMMSMTTDQVEQCNTIDGNCQTTYFEYPNYRFSINPDSILEEIIESHTKANVTSFEYCKVTCQQDDECGGFMFKAAAGLHTCKLAKKTGTIGNVPYTDLTTTLLQDDAADGFTSVTINRPTCGYRILKTRYVDIEIQEDGTLRDRNPHSDGINGLWGYGETIDKGRQWAYHTCRTSITVKKLEKIDADHVSQGLHNGIGENFIQQYPYTIEVNDEGCQGQVIEKEETVSQATSAAVSLTEAEEIVKIHSPSTPEYCRSANGHYTGSPTVSEDGGVCLSHKQKQRGAFPLAIKPFGNTVEKDAKCIDGGGADQIATYPNRKECATQGFTWEEARNFLHQGRAETCFVNGMYQLHNFPTKAACEAASGVWTDAVTATSGLAYITDENYELLDNQCVAVGVTTEAGCVDASGNAVWNDVIDKCYYPHVLTQLNCVKDDDRINLAVAWSEFYTADTVPLDYEDERLTCGGLGLGAKHSNGPYTSRYDRIRMIVFIDVLRLKDLYTEGKGASTIVPRGLPIGLVEGYTPITGIKDPFTNIKHVGQHRLEIGDQDVVYYNPTTEEKCTLKEAADPATGCVTYSYASGYRASGRGDTYRGRTQQERDDRNQIRKVVGEYLIRDVGIDEASTSSLGTPFWKDELTTISYLGTSTSTDSPLELSVQDIREDYGDAKLYSRYMVELFSECQDMTQQQQHSSRLHIQTFKEGRLHGERIRDSLEEVTAGTYNEGYSKYSISTSAVDGDITLPDDIGQPLNDNDLVTIHSVSGQTCAQDGQNFMLKNAGYEQDFTTTTINVALPNAGMHVCDDMGASTTETTLQACVDVAAAASALSFSYATGDGLCVMCNTVVGVTAVSPVSDHYTPTTQDIVTYQDTYTYKATVVNFPSAPREMGSALTGVTIDKDACEISLMERKCDGYSYDITTADLLSKASPVHEVFQITTKDVCGPVELDQSGCTGAKSLWGDKGTCSPQTQFTNQYDCETNGNTWTQTCKFLRPCGPDAPAGFDQTCTSPSNSRCQICNFDTPECYDTTKGSIYPDGGIVGRAKSIDIACAGYDFTNPDIKLGINVKKVIDTLPDNIENLDFTDLPTQVQSYGVVFGAELVEFSIGFNIMDTILFDEDQYLQMEGMGTSRTEVIAFLKNNRISEIASVNDVRSMADLTYPQLTTEEVIFTVQSYDPNYDPELHNVNIETLSICSHQQLSYFEPYIALGKIERNVVNCLVGKINDGRDAYGNVLLDSRYETGTDACEYVYNTCPHKPMTGFTLKREDNNYFLLADYRPLYGQSGHQFIDDTCDLLSVTRLMDLLTFPDFENEYDNNMVYQFANNLPEKCVTEDGVTTCALSGDEAVKQACVHVGSDPDSTLTLNPEDFFKRLGPKDQQVPVTQTVVRNFKSMMMKEAKDLDRGVREVVPCRRLSMHGDDLSPEFANTILYGYDTGFGDLSKFGDRFEPRNCWFDSFTQQCSDASGVDVTATHDSGEKCRMPEQVVPSASVSLVPNKCTPFELGFYDGTPGVIKTLDNFYDRFSSTDDLYTSDECNQVCEDNQVNFCMFVVDAVFSPKGTCYFVGGSASVSVDPVAGQYYISSCVADTTKVDSTAVGRFSAYTAVDTAVATTEAEAKQNCAASATCVGFHELPAAPPAIVCVSGAIADIFEAATSIPDAVANPDVVKDVNECMFQCKGVNLPRVDTSEAASDYVEFVQDTACKCKLKKVGEVCATTGAGNTIGNHFANDVSYDVVGNVPTNIVITRDKEYELFSVIDVYSVDSTSVKGLSSKYFIKPKDGCEWCTWDNTQPRTHQGDSENCMTNVLGHLQNADSFENYLDSIGPALDMEQEICVQKNNIYRTVGSKHIPCGYNNLYNFDLDSVYPPEQFEMTDEEVAYRLNPMVPSWDALIYHPDDIGDIANHWEPITKNFILPVKAEVVIQGHACADDYDFAAAGRRRLLGNRKRQRIGRRQLLQEEGQDPGQFGVESRVAFNIEFNIEVLSQVGDTPVTVNGRLVYPGDKDYPQSKGVLRKVQKTPADLIPDNSTDVKDDTKKCVDMVNMVYLASGYGYIGLLFIISLLSAAVDLRLNSFK